MVNDFEMYFDLNSQIVAANFLAGDGGLQYGINKMKGLESAVSIWKHGLSSSIMMTQK